MTEQQLLELVEAAIRAPSSHNTQPWLFRLGPRRMDLLADRTRALPVNDPFDRELTISCGAALFNLRVAAARASLVPNVTPFPDSEDGDTLARVELAPGQPDRDLAALASAIPARHTTRLAFRDVIVPEGIEPLLVAAAQREGARLDLLDETTREPVAALVAEGDEAQFSDPTWRRELASWMHPRRQAEGLAMATPAVPFARLVVRHFDLGKRTGQTDADLARKTPLLGVISTGDDTPASWLQAGQALERVLLAAADRGLTAGYLNQPCQLETLRPALADAACPGRHPQILLRLGFGEEPKAGPSPRRPLEDVVSEA